MNLYCIETLSCPFNLPQAMFTSGMKESTHERVTISGVEPETIGLLVSYAYTSKVSISAANVQVISVIKHNTQAHSVAPSAAL